MTMIPTVNGNIVHEKSTGPPPPLPPPPPKDRIPNNTNAPRPKITIMTSRTLMMKITMITMTTRTKITISRPGRARSPKPACAEGISNSINSETRSTFSRPFGNFLAMFKLGPFMHLPYGIKRFASLRVFSRFVLHLDTNVAQVIHAIIEFLKLPSQSVRRVDGPTVSECILVRSDMILERALTMLELNMKDGDEFSLFPSPTLD